MNVRRVLDRSEENPGLKKDLMELCSMRGLLGVRSKAYINVPYRLGI